MILLELEKPKSHIQTSSKRMDLADARSHIPPRTHKNLIENSQETASGLRAQSCALRAGAQRAAVQVAPGGRAGGRGDPGRRPGAGVGGGSPVQAEHCSSPRQPRKPPTAARAGQCIPRGRGGAPWAEDGDSGGPSTCPAGRDRPRVPAKRRGAASWTSRYCACSVPFPSRGSHALLPPRRVRSRWAAPWGSRGRERVGLLVWDSPSGRGRCGNGLRSWWGWSCWFLSFAGAFIWGGGAASHVPGHPQKCKSVALLVWLSG